MKYAHEVMERDFTSVSPDTSVKELGRILLKSGKDGVPVIDDGELVGIATSMDLVFQEKQVHLPSMLVFLDAVLPLGRHRTEEELHKISGVTVRDIMSEKPVTVPFDSPLEHVATLMVERHFTIVPVMNGKKIVGIVTKRSILQALFGSEKAVVEE